MPDGLSGQNIEMPDEIAGQNIEMPDTISGQNIEMPDGFAGQNIEIPDEIASQQLDDVAKKVEDTIADTSTPAVNEEDNQTPIKEVVEPQNTNYKITPEEYAMLYMSDQIGGKIDNTTPYFSLGDVTKEIVGSDTYFEFGYVEQFNPMTQLKEYSTYIRGLQTTQEQLKGYTDTLSEDKTASYSGNIAALIQDGQASLKSTGDIKLNINFSNNTFDGKINVTEGNWKVDIPYSPLSATSLSSTALTTATSSGVSNISGAIDGQFYGDKAQAVGGSFNLSSIDTTKTVIGTYGAKR
jgi:hypothetical protein